MRAVVTRVTEASVTIDGAEYSRIGRGFLVLLGVHVSDTEAEARPASSTASAAYACLRTPMAK